MPPNVQLNWEHITARHNRLEDEDEELLVHDSVIVKPPPQQEENHSDVGKILWEARLKLSTTGFLDEDDSETVSLNPTLVEALSSIIVLDDATKKQDWLNLHNGNLSDVSPKLLQGLRQRAPKHFSARVADFNDNLFYYMQQTRGFDHFDLDDTTGIQQLEAFLQANEFLGSFLSTESSLPQPPHVDYTYDVLKEHEASNTLRIGFFPLTKDGMFLQVWPTSISHDCTEVVEGQVIYLPYGKILVVPASTIHGGGFRTSSMAEAGLYGNLRFHLYVATDQATLPAHQSNKYTERYDQTRELSQRYIDSRHMPTLMERLFV